MQRVAHAPIGTKRPWSRGLLVWSQRIVIGLLLLMGTGLLWQAIGTAFDTKRFPAPGFMVDVGGHKLHLMGQGKSGPVIILEVGHSANSTQFAWLMPELAKFSQVYAYDRAGYGWSEEAKGPWSVERAADELLVLLESAGVQGPYILVSHSLGGTIHRAFAAKYPERVAGLVLLDPEVISTSEEILDAMLPMHRIQNAMAHLGSMRIAVDLGLLSVESLAGQLPLERQQEAVAMGLANKNWRTALREYRGMYSTNEILQALGPVSREIPLTVISANTMQGELPGDLADLDVIALMQEAHGAWAAASAQGRHVILQDADHMDAGGLNQRFVGQIVAEIRRMAEMVKVD